ncbi:MAG TPA: hypothetical protein VLX28_18575, partial [Thermoanaerobaculia bacterium]|nr:hypothetical protein [Thermoanaerobaculia bacterium]
VRSSIRNIQDQEQGIFESYFKKFEGTSQAKEFRRLGEQISLSSIPSGPFKNEIELPQLQSNIVRAKQNFENLIFKRTLDTVVAMILAVGLDFMVLLCSWATNFGIPLRVVPNQELTVDTLLHPGPLQDKIPDFVKNVSRGKRGTSIEFWLSKFSTAQQIALADLINKAKVKQKSGSEEFDVAPDFVDFLLRDAYDMAIKESVYQDTERDLRTAEIIGLVIHYKSGLAIPAESIRDKTAISIAVLSLKARGFLVEKRTFWRGAIFYIVTEELIDAWNLQLQAGEYSSAQSLHPQPSLRTDPAPP